MDGLRDVPAGAWLMAASIALAAVGAVPANWIMARSSGWRTLARRYPAVAVPDGPRFWALCSLSRPGGQRQWVRITAGATGLHLQAPFVSQPGRPPFSVPWSEVAAAVETPWYGPRVWLRFERTPEVRIRVTPAIGRRIVDGSRGQLVLR